MNCFDDVNGCKNLLATVLDLAFEDLILKHDFSNPNLRTTLYPHKYKALAWFKSTETHYASFEYICSVLKLSPEPVRSYALQVCKTGTYRPFHRGCKLYIYDNLKNGDEKPPTFWIHRKNENISSDVENLPPNIKELNVDCLKKKRDANANL